MKLKKKGSGQDILFMAIFLVIFAVVSLITYTIYSEINDKLQENPTIANNTQAVNAANQLETQYTGIIDNAFLFLTIGLGLVAFVLAGLVRIHPIFFVFYIFLLGIIIFLAAVFSNIYGEIAANPNFTSLANDLLFTSQIMNTLPFIVGIFGTLLAVIMYKNYRSVI